MFLLSGLLTLPAQTNFYTLMTNGPTANRLNVVFLAEGYTAAQFGAFLNQASNTANVFLTNVPFAEYAPYINYFAIAVASAQSGSDHPAWPQFVSTYFNSTYDFATDTLIAIPSDGNGQGKVDALLNTFVPGASLAVLLVNDTTPGGSDGGGKTAIAATAPNSLAAIPLHEAGHVLAGLGDEYTTANPSYRDIEEPNTTRETNRTAIKWNAWIATNTPVPTPISYVNDIGLFEGAHYHPTGWFRPKLHCRMGAAIYTAPFCEVCTEALVRSFYARVRPIESAAPAGTNWEVSTPQALNFNLSLLKPTDHALAVQWLTNGIPVRDATNSAFLILPEALGDGTNTVSARVTDSTPRVRTDANNLLSQTQTWTLILDLPQLHLTSPQWLVAGGFTFRVTGVAPAGFAIQASTNLVSWAAVATNSLVGGHYDYTNTSGSNQPQKFFRAVTPP